MGVLRIAITCDRTACLWLFDVEGDRAADVACRAEVCSVWLSWIGGDDDKLVAAGAPGVAMLVGRGEPVGVAEPAVVRDAAGSGEGWSCGANVAKQRGPGVPISSQSSAGGRRERCWREGESVTVKTVARCPAAGEIVGTCGCGGAPAA